MHDDELCGLWQALTTAYPDPSVRDALEQLAYANRAAYMLSYSELPDEPIVTLAAPGEYRRVFPSVREWIDNLEYNCIAQGGTDYAPKEALRTLREAARVSA